MGIEFDQEIEIALRRVEIVPRRRAENIEPPHMETAAQIPQFLAMQCNVGDHRPLHAPIEHSTTCRRRSAGRSIRRAPRRILSTGQGAPANPVEATKWHLISRAGGETDLELDAVMDKLDPATRAAGEKAAKPWLDAMKAAQTAQAQAAQAKP